MSSIAAVILDWLTEHQHLSSPSRTCRIPVRNDARSVHLLRRHRNDFGRRLGHYDDRAKKREVHGVQIGKDVWEQAPKTIYNGLFGIACVPLESVLNDSRATETGSVWFN